MMQRFGAVFAIAIVSSVFAAHGHLGSPAGITSGFRPALAVSAALSLLGAMTALAVATRRPHAAARPGLDPEPDPASAPAGMAR
jgi:hypothetical protein